MRLRKVKSFEEFRRVSKSLLTDCAVRTFGLSAECSEGAECLENVQNVQCIYCIDQLQSINSRTNWREFERSTGRQQKRGDPSALNPFRNHRISCFLILYSLPHLLSLRCLQLILDRLPNSVERFAALRRMFQSKGSKGFYWKGMSSKGLDGFCSKVAVPAIRIAFYFSIRNFQIWTSWFEPLDLNLSIKTSFRTISIKTVSINNVHWTST